MKIRFKITSALALIVALMAVVAKAADVERVTIKTDGSFVVEDNVGASGVGPDNFRVHHSGIVEVSRSALSLKDGDDTTVSAGKLRLFEGSGGGVNSITFKAPDRLAEDGIITLPGTDGIAGQVLQTDGKGVLSWVVGQATGTGSTAACGGEAVIDLVATNNGGRTWMDRNLGASQKATSSTDASAYGSLFQWGRGKDGHECSQTTYNGPISEPGMGANNPWTGKFIIGSSNWLSYNSNTLWGNGTSSGTTKTRNDPCPVGYQVPNANEMRALGLKNSQDAFDVLRLTTGGYRDAVDGRKSSSGGGFYWTSSILNTIESAKPIFWVSTTRMVSVNGINFIFRNGMGRGYGMAVRCIKSL